MLSSTIRIKNGIYHKACGKGVKTSDKVFYSRWQAMRTRTSNPNYEHAGCYSGKGISSDDFKNFIDFYDTMHDSFIALADRIGSKNVSLERLDNSKDYTADNCIWINKHDQPKNTSRTVKFKTIYPDGHEEVHTNARGFAIANGLCPSAVMDAINGRTAHHKGIRFERIST